MMAVLSGGILLPSELLHSGWFATLSTFVAINTVMFTALAIAKVMPRLHPSSWFRNRNQRSETRSIYPDTPSDQGVSLESLHAADVPPGSGHATAPKEPDEVPRPTR